MRRYHPPGLSRAAYWPLHTSGARNTRSRPKPACEKLGGPAEGGSCFILTVRLRAAAGIPQRGAGTVRRIEAGRGTVGAARTQTRLSAVPAPVARVPRCSGGSRRQRKRETSPESARDGVGPVSAVGCGGARGPRSCRLRARRSSPTAIPRGVYLRCAASRPFLHQL